MNRATKMIVSTGAAVGLLSAGMAVVSTAAANASSATTMYAVVNSSGTLARASAGTSSTHPGTGQYDVWFSHSIKGCQPIANLGYPGTSEAFTFQGVTTVQTLSDNHTVAVTMTYPGDTTAGNYPHTPVVRDNSFQLAVNCHWEPGAKVSAAGRGSGAIAYHTGVGRYLVDFTHDVSGCAPVATVATPAPGAPSALQAHLALGQTSSQVTVQISDSELTPKDATFYIADICSNTHAVFNPSSGFYNQMGVANTARCALVGSWYQNNSQSPINQGYVSTWATSGTTAGIQTKNGGYGIQSGFGVSLAAICS